MKSPVSRDHVVIFDTTMRDGEQSPGASMTREEKLRIARQLERMKVDVMEAGFAAASNGDFEAVREIAGLRITRMPPTPPPAARPSRSGRTRPSRRGCSPSGCRGALTFHRPTLTAPPSRWSRAE